MDRAILRALAEEPQGRFPTMEEFGAAVYPESGRPVYSTSSETIVSSVRVRTRRRWLVPSAVGAVVVVAALWVLWAIARYDSVDARVARTCRGFDRSASGPDAVRPCPPAPSEA